ncbi:MAG: NUDIX hydrolase, partial [Bacteroidota bacterium]
MPNQNHTEDPFRNKVRVRVCGILRENNQILLLRHDSIGPQGYLWSPPGGGVSFGESLEDRLEKEFLEEVNLTVEVNDYLFTNEYIGNRHHAIEIFYRVTRVSGEVRLGMDPELPPDKQILCEAKFFSGKELEKLPDGTLH